MQCHEFCESAQEVIDRVAEATMLPESQSLAVHVSQWLEKNSTGIDAKSPARFIVLGGGRLMEEFAKQSPWECVKDKEGNALPFIVKTLHGGVPPGSEEAVVIREARRISGVLLAKTIEDLCRANAIESQKAAGVTYGQTKMTSQGLKTFRRAGGFESVVLELAYGHEKRSEASSAFDRQFFYPRIWDHGELVVDGMPDAPGAKHLRFSLGGGLYIDPNEPVVDDVRLGDILRIVLEYVTDSAEQDDKTLEDLLLPERTIGFLRSTRCDEIAMTARDLEEDDATISADGTVVLREGYFDDQSSSSSPSP